MPQTTAPLALPSICRIYGGGCDSIAKEKSIGRPFIQWWRHLYSSVDLQPIARLPGAFTRQFHDLGSNVSVRRVLSP